MISDTPRIAKIVVAEPTPPVLRVGIDYPNPAVQSITVLPRTAQPYFQFQGQWDQANSCLDLWLYDGTYIGSAQLFDNGKSSIPPVP